MSTLPSRSRRLASLRWLGVGVLGSAGLALLVRALGWPAPQLAPAQSAHTARTAQSPQTALAQLPPSALCTAPLRGAAPAQALQRALSRARSQPERAESWVELGRQWLAQAHASADAGHALNAAACAEQALSLTPEHAGALGLLARVQLEAHEFSAARSLAERVLARDPEDRVALASLSDAALELGDIAAASSAAQRLMDVHPGVPAYARASYLRWLHGQEQAALELARMAIDAAGDPDERVTLAWTLEQAAQLFWHRGDVDGAAAGYRMAIAAHPSHAPALLGLAHVAASRQQWADAAQHARQALAAQPSVAAAALLGDVLARAGDVEGAALSYDRAEQLGRFDRHSLSRFYSARALEPARALQLARAERQLRAGPYTEDALAWALYRTGDFTAAAAHAERAQALGTRDALLLFHQGAILLALGQRGRGRALLGAALEQNPHFDLAGAAEARRLLLESA